mmetsp:Transcript_10265/g.35465  ORF Transcript_10265/g.35465 Transcript_10265/m.35465 type:complete len:236 (+) Transcript_10265:411-1118(+)
MVWISDVADRRNPCFSAPTTATSDTIGRSRPSRSRLHPTSAWSSPALRRRSASKRLPESRPLCKYVAATPFSVSRSAMPSADAFVSVVTSARSPAAAAAATRARRWSSSPPAAAASTTDTTGSTTPVGRTISDVTASSPHMSKTSAFGVAVAKTHWGTLAQNSASVSGRLSSADLRRKPFSTSDVLRARSPACMPRSWGTATWASSTTRSQSSSGKKSTSVAGASPAARRDTWRA